jgi:hypothetical protein
MASRTPPVPTVNPAVGSEKVHEKVHLLSRVMDAAAGRRIVLVVDEVGFDHRLVIESASESLPGPSEQCEANR